MIPTRDRLHGARGTVVRVMASPLRRLRARLLKAFFQSHTAIYRLSGGRIGANVGLPALLLTTTGRKSGQPRTTPLVYFRDGDRYVVVGSDGAARRHPQWHQNLLVDPNAEIQVGPKKLRVIASVASGDERARLWKLGEGVNPMWQRYQTRTPREIPVVVLTPRS